MNQPRQFHLIPGEVLAIQRNGTPHRDLEIAEWMERSQPHGEYRATTGAFVVITPTVDLPAGTDDWIVRFADGRFMPCPDRVFAAIAIAAATSAPQPSLCSECCDPVPLAELYPIPSGAQLCTDCLLEYQFLQAPDRSAELDRNAVRRSTHQEARP
jgi:hypothetical protein